MIDEFSVVVPAPAGEEERTASVYYPAMLQGAPAAVLYLFDGQTAFFDRRAPFGNSLRLGEFLDAHNIPLMVAAVDCDAHNRLTEYSPFTFSQKGKYSSEGKGGVYMDWLTGTFKPMIDRRYPTIADRAHTFVMGSSMGGLMAIYALADYGKYFSRAVAMSPSLWVDAAASVALVGRLPKDARLYLDYGSAEFSPSYPAQRTALDAVVSALGQWGGEFRFDLIRGARHSETAWRKRLPAALSFLGFTC